jgi:RNA polymerase primary sigma factor
MREDLKTYFNAIGRRSVIPHDRIVSLYQAIDDAQEKCDVDVAALHTRTDIDDVTRTSLITAIQRRVDNMRAHTYNEIVEANLRLVISAAKRFSTTIDGMSANISLSDLIQEGSLGLMEGVKRFNHKLGFRLGTYVGFWIRRAIIRHLTGADDRGSVRIVRLPAYVVKLKQGINKIRADEASRRNAGQDVVPMSNEEIALKLDVDIDAVNATISASGRQCAIVSETGGAGTIMSTTIDGIMSTDDASDGLFDIERNVLVSEVMGSITTAFEMLSPREEAVLRLRFGIGANADDSGARILDEQEIAEIRTHVGPSL